MDAQPESSHGVYGREHVSKIGVIPAMVLLLRMVAKSCTKRMVETIKHHGMFTIYQLQDFATILWRSVMSYNE